MENKDVSAEAPLVEPDVALPSNRLKKASAVAAALAVGLLVAVTFAAPGPKGLRSKKSAGVESIISAYDSEVCDARIMSACDFVPYYAPGAVLHSNLGHHGPDYGPEGLVYEVFDHSPFAATFNTSYLIVINATSKYTPAEAKKNGKWHEYASINMKPNSHHEQRTSFSLRLLEKETRKEFYPGFFSMTFFDFDEQTRDKATESLLVHDYSAFMVTNTTELAIKHADNATRQFASFAATTKGSGSDNPTDPMHLTTQQFNRAVSIVFTGKHKIDFELAVAPGSYDRFFIFTFRSSLACAINQETGKKEDLILHTPKSSHDVWREWCEDTYKDPEQPESTKPWWMDVIIILVLILMITVMCLLLCNSGETKSPADGSGGYSAAATGGSYGGGAY